MLADIRAFFATRGVLEVQTPALSPAANPDPAIDSLRCDTHLPGSASPQRCYLHTSPEFAMKRLLAAGSGDIYQLCRVFRDGEAGRLHQPEFTLLEWYRLGFDSQRLMNEVAELVRSLLNQDLPEQRMSYREAFLQYLDIDPFTADDASLAALAVRQGVDISAPGMTRDDWLNLLMSHCIEPALPMHALVFIHGWPASQASLARLSADGEALRFELYLNGLELANGFEELTDATEQRRRFEWDNRQRRRQGKPLMPIDEAFLSALAAGLPDCAGVALGIDRLMMIAAGRNHIHEVQVFPLNGG